MNRRASARRSPDAQATNRGWRRGGRWAALGIAVVAIVGALGAAGDAAKAPGPTELRTGEGGVAPRFALPDLEDPATTVELDDRGGRPAVVNFWASWCLPCRREMPALQASYDEFGDRVAFIGVNHQDNRDDALEFVADVGVDYPSGMDPDGGTARDYGLFGMPSTVFVARDGTIVGTRTGELTADELDRTIRELLLEDGT